MLYTVFLYQAKTGLMLYKKSFEIGFGEKSELFSSFFSAIQSFVKSMILKDTKDKGLESLDLGKYLVNVTDLPDLNLNIVLISDREDRKPIKKFLPKLITIVRSHKELYDNWDGNLTRFDVLDLELIQLLQSNKKLSGQDKESEDKTDLMDTILDQLPELEKEQQEKYLKEKQYLEDLIKKEKNFTRKLEIIASIQEVCQKLKDRKSMEDTIKKKKKIIHDMKIMIEKLLYYIKQTKSSINDAVERQTFVPLPQIDFKDAYIHLYSFSSNLKQFGQLEQAEKYREMAMDLIKKPEEREKINIPEIIKIVMNLPEDISHYIPNLPKIS